MAINWSVLVPGPGGLSIPTYGNYGGPGYSDGEILVDPNQGVDYSEEPVDDLDELFMRHDMAYDSTDPSVRAAGDVTLAKGIAGLSDEQLDAEASAYGGFATLFAMYLLVEVNRQPDLLTIRDYLFLTRSALDDIERGFAEADPELLAEFVNWIGESTGTDVDVPVGILTGEHSFDFSKLAHASASDLESTDLLLDHAERPTDSSDEGLVQDAVEGLINAGSHAFDLQHTLLKNYMHASASFDWLT